MNILHVSSAKSWRGGEQQLVNLIHGLNDLKVRNHLLCPKDAPLANYAFNDQCYIHTYLKLSSYNPVTSIKILTLSRRHQFDFIHVHDSHSHNYAITAASMGMKTPIIVSRKVDFPTTSRSKYNHSAIAAIICVSDHVREILDPIFKRKNKLYVVHDSVDLNKKMELSNSLKTKYNIADHSIVVANISALADHKDPVTFLNTAKYLEEHHDEHSFAFLIIGPDAGKEKELKIFSQNLKFKSKVIFTGFLPDAHQHLNEIDLFLFTSKEEGMGSTLLDAMLYGVPIVSTDAGGIRELIKHGYNGLTANVKAPHDLAEHVIKILKDQELKNELIKNGYIVADSHSILKMAEETLLIYQDQLLK